MKKSNQNLCRGLIATSLLVLSLTGCSKQANESEIASDGLPAEMTTPDASLPEASASK